MHTLKIFNDEVWYGGATGFAADMPLDEDSEYKQDLTQDSTGNQMSAVLLSSAGRYICSPTGFKFAFSKGVIVIDGDAEVVKAGDTLKDAYLAAMKKYFPPDGKKINSSLYLQPQYSTWIELQFNQTESGILGYAESIIKSCMPPGILIIDDGWQENYGDWNFNAKKFTNPKQMFFKLRQMGFTPILWVLPYITPDTPTFRWLQAKDLLIKDKHGETAIRKWWNGYGAVLDLTNPETVTWFKSRLAVLQSEYNVCGFKFDGGDHWMYREDDIVYGDSSVRAQASKWSQIACEYSICELRTSYNFGGRAIVQRLLDKRHSWDGDSGLNVLISQTTAQGLMGYWFTCPDMIGGGQYADFSKDAVIDEELFIRSAQLSALMPMLQFSYAIWEKGSAKTLEHILNALKLREVFIEEVAELIDSAAKTGLPVVRNLEFEFPHQGLGHIKDEFLVGEKILVAPVLQKQASKRRVVLPKGQWKLYATGEIFQGGNHYVEVDVDSLPVFRKISV